MKRIILTTSIIALASRWVEAQTTWTVNYFTNTQKKETLSLLTQIPNTWFFVKWRENVSDEYEVTVLKKSDTWRLRITNNWLENNTEQKTVHFELRYNDICTWISYFFALTIEVKHSTEPNISLESPSDRIIRITNNVLSQNLWNVLVSLKRQRNLPNDTLHTKINENWELVTIEEDPSGIFLRALKLIVSE
jgi:hypothetical protein